MATMRSPLPDSTNLEAGILEDARPSRLSRVHSNVRELLRRSVFGSVHSTPVASPTRSPQNHIDPAPTILPIAQRPRQHQSPARPLGTSTTSSPDDVPGVLFPPWREAHNPSRQQPSPTRLFPTYPMSAADNAPGEMFVAERSPPCPPSVIASGPQTAAPREHPDLSPNVMSLFLQQKDIQRHHQDRQQKAWKRHRNRKPSNSTSGAQWVICSILGVAVLGLLGKCKMNMDQKIAMM